MHAALVSRESTDLSEAVCEQENCKRDLYDPFFHDYVG